MPSYQYKAIDRNGKTVKDTLDASSLDTAKNSLRALGYTVLELKELNALNKDIELPFLGNPTAKDMSIFCRQFRSILRAGVSVTNVLAMLAQQTENPKLVVAIRDMQTSIEKGETLAGSMRKHPKIFPSMLVNMTAAGEESGSLEETFRQMELWFDKAQRTKRSVGKAMIYPAILISVMIIVLIVMMVKIIPSFMGVFDNMNMALPGPTLAVIAVSDWFTEWWWLLVALIVVLGVGGVFFSRTNHGKHFFGFLARKIPLVKTLTVRSASATYCRTLALLLGSGLQLLDALELVANNMSNIYFKEAVLAVRTMASEGWPLNTSLSQTKVFPPMVCNLTGIGEETGDLQAMMEKTADYYDEEVEAATQKLLSMMEPIIMLFLAGFVLILVLAIFLPMLNMNSAYDQYL
jgi:type IV pilus assembly protein PilC